MEEYKRYTVTKDELALSVSLASSDILIQSCDGDDVIIEVEDKKRADKMLDIRFEDNKLTIEELNKGWGMLQWNYGYDEDLVLKIPANKKCSGNCEVASGDLEIENISYTGRISSASGDVNAEKIEGKLEIRSASGDIELEDMNLSGLNISVLSGDFSFSGKLASGEDSSIKTVSGDISLDFENVENLSIFSQAVSGDIEVDGSYSSELKEEMKKYKRLTIKTVSGDIEINLDDSCKNIYIAPLQSVKTAIHNRIHSTIDNAVKDFIPRIPKGVKFTEEDNVSRKEHISRILKMVEDGKIGADDASKLIDSL